jgi:hypothetical protein
MSSGIHRLSLERQTLDEAAALSRRDSGFAIRPLLSQRAHDSRRPLMGCISDDTSHACQEEEGGCQRATAFNRHCAAVCVSRLQRAALFYVLQHGEGGGVLLAAAHLTSAQPAKRLPRRLALRCGMSSPSCDIARGWRQRQRCVICPTAKSCLSLGGRCTAPFTYKGTCREARRDRRWPTPSLLRRQGRFSKRVRHIGRRMI